MLTVNSEWRDWCEILAQKYYPSLQLENSVLCTTTCISDSILQLVAADDE